jgi:hypothetical protein
MIFDLSKTEKGKSSSTGFCGRAPVSFIGTEVAVAVLGLESGRFA